MPGDVVLIGDTRVTNGNIDVDSFTLTRGARIRAEVDVNLSARHDVLILGTIDCAELASFSIHTAEGSIVVSGAITAGDGRDAGSKGQRGEDAGAIRLSAPNGEVIIDGSLTTLDGGRGADASDHPTKSQTQAGHGAHGGNIEINAQIISLRGGAIASGAGGDGGNAEADGWDNGAEIAWVFDNVKPGDLPIDPPQFPIWRPEFVDEGEIAQAKVLAISGNGGNGGTISLNAVTLGFITAASAIVSGDGGHAGWSKAMRSVEARAEVGAPGPGGQILLEDASAVWTVDGSLTAGAGGTAGLTAAPNQPAALATALQNAVAKIPPGGVGGTTSTGSTGQGGSVGLATVKTKAANCDNSDGPNPGGPAGPGGAAQANCP